MRFRSRPLLILSLLLFSGILCVLHANAWAETGNAQANPLATGDGSGGDAGVVGGAPAPARSHDRSDSDEPLRRPPSSSSSSSSDARRASSCATRPRVEVSSEQSAWTSAQFSLAERIAASTVSASVGSTDATSRAASSSPSSSPSSFLFSSGGAPRRGGAGWDASASSQAVGSEAFAEVGAKGGAVTFRSDIALDTGGAGTGGARARGAGGGGNTRCR